MTKIFGIPNGDAILNPYYNSPKPKLITWEKFYLAIPGNLLQSLFATIFLFTVIVLGDKDKNDIENNEEQITDGKK